MLIYLSFKFQKWKTGVLIYWPPYLTQDLGDKPSHKRTGGELFQEPVMISIFVQCLLSEQTNLFWGHFDVTKLIPNTVEDDCVHKTSSFKLETANFIFYL